MNARLSSYPEPLRTRAGRSWDRLRDSRAGRALAPAALTVSVFVKKNPGAVSSVGLHLAFFLALALVGYHTLQDGGSQDFAGANGASFLFGEDSRPEAPSGGGVEAALSAPQFQVTVEESKAPDVAAVITSTASVPAFTISDAGQIASAAAAKAMAQVNALSGLGRAGTGQGTGSLTGDGDEGIGTDTNGGGDNAGGVGDKGIYGGHGASPYPPGKDPFVGQRIHIALDASNSMSVAGRRGKAEQLLAASNNVKTTRYFSIDWGVINPESRVAMEMSGIPSNVFVSLLDLLERVDPDIDLVVVIGDFIEASATSPNLVAADSRRVAAALDGRRLYLITVGVKPAPYMTSAAVMSGGGVFEDTRYSLDLAKQLGLSSK